MAKRIDSKISRTAKMTCLSRAVSYSETREYYHSGDYISVKLVPPLIKGLLKLPIIRYCYSRWSPGGIYQYVIARTKYIDQEFFKALQEGFEQVIIFGAGFDSRAIRFHNANNNTKIFEIDTPIIQSAKIKRYQEAGIEVPDNLTFIPVDFDKQSIIARFVENGLAKNKKSLFILEGLTMYLQPESVAKTFKTIQGYAGTGSKLVFDYIFASVLRNENLYDGEKEIVNSVAKANEKWCFGIEKGSIKEFLSQYDFEIINHLDATDLKALYFNDAGGNKAIKVNGMHCIVTAVKKEAG